MRVENLNWAWKRIEKQKAFTWLLLTSIKNWYKTQIQKLRLLHCSKWWRLNLIETWIRKLMLPCSWLFLSYNWEFRSFKRMKTELCTHDARECVLRMRWSLNVLYWFPKILNFVFHSKEKFTLTIFCRSEEKYHIW